jgi:ADP-ribose pyrophosphatase YjhB (NUDIX family)
MKTRDFVATTFCVNNNKVLLVKHKKLNMWLPPGGHIDENELPCEAAVREFKEETGLDIELVGQEGIIGDVRKLIHPKHIQLEDIDEGHQHIDLIYFGRLKDPNQSMILQKEEVENMVWFSEEELENDEIIEEIKITSKLAIKEVGKNE